MVSLDIGDEKIRAVCGKREKGAVLVSAYFEAALSGSDATQGDSLSGLIARLPQADRRAVVSLSDCDLFVHRLTLPNARPRLLDAMITHALREFPATKDCYIDYKVERARTDAGKRVLDLLVCGVPKPLADAQYAAVTAAGLIPHRMDLRQNCVHKLLASHPVLNGQSLRDTAVLLLEVSCDQLSCDLIVDGAGVFERIVPLGRLANLYGDSSNVHGFDLIGSAGASSGENPLYARISDEAQRMLQFSLTRAAKRPVSQVFLHGENASDAQLAKYLMDSLGIPIQPVLESPGVWFAAGYDGPDVGAVFGCAAALF